MLRIEKVRKLKIPLDIKYRQYIGVIYLLLIVGILLYLLIITRGL